ncbi:MAG: nucleotidyltransferase domain-containing protein [Candidatus Brockarchaeota archaeon]|nr:nucleotidyltransferase domain-containing protein [Candidatus Brockarchaeota archaeon]
MTEFDLYVEEGRRTLEALSNPVEVGRRVKKLVLKFWPNAKVYIFGSSVRGKYTASSDIDILIVEDVDYGEASKVKAQIYMTIDYPMEIHVATWKQFAEWYMRFIKEGEILEV